MKTVATKARAGFGLLKRLKPDLKKPPVIDHPLENEKVGPGEYAIRITAPAGSQVEISFNDRDWLPCREAVGHWWFDWQAYGSSKCRILARSRVGNGKWTTSSPRNCRIVTINQPLEIGLTFD